jgi:hypothetical protein
MRLVNLITTWINLAPIKVTQEDEDDTGENTGNSNKYLNPKA